MEPEINYVPMAGKITLKEDDNEKLDYQEALRIQIDKHLAATNNKVSYVVDQLPKVHAAKEPIYEMQRRDEDGDAEGEMDKMHAFEDELDNFDKELATIMGKSDNTERDSMIYGVSKEGSNLQVGTMMPACGDSL